MDQYVSWCLSAHELNLDTIWSKYKIFASPKEISERKVWHAYKLFPGQHIWGWVVLCCTGLCVLLNTHKKLQTSCMLTAFGFTWKMKNLCLKWSMTVVLILTSFLQAMSGSLQRKWRHQRQSMSHQASCKWPKSVWWDINGQTSHQASTRKKSFKSRPPSNKWYTREQQQVPPYKDSLILNKLIQAKKGVPSVVIPDMLNDSVSSKEVPV